ncbi:hypothetical protein Q1695_004032 [Nippostrongylus brasiliensis]|nr:hypothetical protein Q1695_004032 [Nippostrongylus brasiliensis]
MLLSIALWAVYVVVGYFLLKRFVLEQIYINYRGKYVFITGCDSGFGRLLALKLLSMGVNVIAGCYTEYGCEDLNKCESRIGGGARLYTLQIDITSDQSVAKAQAEVEHILHDQKAQLHGIVNNAGVFTIFGPDDWCSTNEYLASLNVNTLGAVRVCHSFLPLIKKSKGRVVTMGSTAGRLHGLYVGPYVTAKFAVEAYMDCLRLEMRPFDVSVHILEPGAFKTELLSEAAQHARVNKIWNNLPAHVKNEYGEQFKENFKVAWQTGVNIVANPNLDWVVDSYVHALFGFWPRMRYAPGWDAIFCFIPLSLMPTSSSPLLEKFLGFFGKAGHVSLLSVVVGAVYLKSLFLYVTTGAARTANHTLAAE